MLALLLSLCATPQELAPQDPAPQPERPHIVLVLADDLGFGDLGCYGAEKIPTPHLDRLAAEGLRLTDAHSASSICSPSRYALLTGRYAWRTSLQRGNVGRFEPLLIDPDTATLPGLLQAAGYRTACVGKWHLGFGSAPRVDFDQPLEPGPLELGFDVFFGSVGKPGRYFGEARRSAEERRSCWYIEGRQLQVGEDEEAFQLEQVGPTLTARAEAEIAAAAKGDEPLFLFLSLTAVHQPLHPAPQVRGKSDLGRYGDFVAEVDWTVGRVRAALEQAGMLEDTLLLFTSDNGPELTRTGAARGHRAAGPWRGVKRDLWEGGHRVPLLARWPGHLPAGRVLDAPLVQTDLLATCLAAAGLERPAGAGPDSVDQLPAWTSPAAGPAASPRPAFVLHSSSGQFALRDGPWKLLTCPGSGGNPYPTGENRTPPGAPPGQLYHLGRDPGERHNLWEQEPERVARMQAHLAALRQDPAEKPAMKPAVKPAADPPAEDGGEDR